MYVICFYQNEHDICLVTSSLFTINGSLVHVLWVLAKGDLLSDITIKAMRSYILQSKLRFENAIVYMYLLYY